MGWRGPNEPGEFATLGYDVGTWIESHVVIPDGFNKGKPYKLTDEMWRFLVSFYRLYPHAEPFPSPDALVYTGAQLRRPQKWGKDPFGAAIILAEALGPSRFDGWDAHGEPVGKPYPTPLIQCLGTSEEQTDNTYLPLLEMIRGGPLVDAFPGARDVGDTRVVLPNGGKIEPVSCSARGRLGAPLTFLTLTESHLFTQQGGFRKVAGAVKRNVAGMNGRWLELTNAWDPTEGSEAQITGDNPDPRVLVDNVEPIHVPDLQNDEALYEALLHVYGDSALERGGWVNIKGRIFDEARSPRHMEADRRRFFLNEIVVGQNVLVDPIHWDRMSKAEELKAGERITLGFDGSVKNDATALIASRISDGKLFCLKVWQRPQNAAKEWEIPTKEVNQVVADTFGAYDVLLLVADPAYWRSHLDTWSGRWPKRVVEFSTNVESRMDEAIQGFLTDFNRDDIANDGNETLTSHMKHTVIVKGSRRKPRPGEEAGPATHYMKLAKGGTLKIDAAVAAVLAHHARSVAIKNGALEVAPTPTPFFIRV